ncbi:MAG: PLP-dependent aminotransferase family protein [Actinomycetota bacterium]
MSSRLVQHLDPRDIAGASATLLATRIRALILDGRLTVGERLPSERALAVELHRSRSTITRTYDLLDAERYVERVHGGGTRVALPHTEPTQRDPENTEAIDVSIASMGSTPGLYDATERALPRLAALRGTSGYSPRGLPELRDAVAQRFTERGAPTSSEEILITGGALQALNLVLIAIGRPGGRALVEQPTFHHAIEAIRRHGYRILPTPVAPDGWDVAHLTDTLLRDRPHLAYLIPDFHNPTGATLEDRDREIVAATAESAGTPLIIDETTAELDIDRGWAPLPVSAFGRAITIGSMSKLAWGGLRIGWIRAERSLITRLLAARLSFDLGTALLEQCIAVELLDDLPGLQNHAADRLRAGRASVADGVATLEGVHMPGTPGGISTWLDLGAHLSTDLSIAARAHGLIIPPGPRFATSGVFERRLRMPITLSPAITAEAMSRLRRAWSELRHGEHVHAEQPSHTPVI